MDALLRSNSNLVKMLCRVLLVMLRSHGMGGGGGPIFFSFKY